METQQTIVAWAIETFGDLGTLPKLAARMNTEVAEVLREAASVPVDNGQVAVECADVAIVLFRIAEIIGIDLRERMIDANEREEFAMKPSVWNAAKWVGEYCGLLIDRVPFGEDVRPGDRYEIAGHARKLGGSLWRLSALCGTPLDEAIDRKMQINRARKWVQGKDSGDHWVRVDDAVEAGTRELLTPQVATPAAVRGWVSERWPTWHHGETNEMGRTDMHNAIIAAIQYFAAQPGPAAAFPVPQTAWTRAQAAFNLLASDPAVWATHGLPDPAKEARIVEVIAEAFAAPRSQEGARYADLVKRLRTLRPNRPGELGLNYWNPDGVEAADAIEALSVS